jgi:hypothetical protein
LFVRCVEGLGVAAAVVKRSSIAGLSFRSTSARWTSWATGVTVFRYAQSALRSSSVSLRISDQGMIGASRRPPTFPVRMVRMKSASS